VGAAQIGLRVTLIGRVAALPEPVMAPLTVDSCACWQTLSSASGEDWSSASGEDWSSEDLLIEDVSGRALVRLLHADIELAGADQSKLELSKSSMEAITKKSQSLCVIQRLLQPGDQVLVAGLATGREVDRTPEVGRLRTGFRDAPTVLLIEGSPDEPVLVRYLPG
jgi:hypothetical protein